MLCNVSFGMVWDVEWKTYVMKGLKLIGIGMVAGI